MPYVNGYPPASTISVDDLIPLLQGSTNVPGTGTTRRATLAQILGGTPGSQYLPLIGGTVTGATTFSGAGTGLSILNDIDIGGAGFFGAPIDIDSFFGLKASGHTVLRTAQVTTQLTQSIASLFLGVNAGAAYPLSTDTLFGSVGIGPGALQSLTQINAEDVALGAWAAQYVVNATGVTAVGMHANGHDNANGNTALGNDAIRDAITDGNITAVGSGAVASGHPSGGTIGVGIQALQGNSSALLFTGTVTAGNTITIGATSSYPGLVGVPFSMIYTVIGGDTLAGIADKIKNLINGTITGPSNLVEAATAQTPAGMPIIWLTFPGNTTLGWAITWTATVSGGATIAVAVKTGSAPNQTIAIGAQALVGYAMGAVTDTVAIGHQAGTNVQVTAETTLIGAATGSNVTTGDHLTLIGARAGLTASTATFATIIGFGVGSTTFATGNAVLLIGSGGTAVDAPSGSTHNYLNIENILTCDGTNNGVNSNAAIAGNLKIGNAIWQSAANALTATGTNQATAFALLTQIARFTTVTSGTGVSLPLGNAGIIQAIFNAGVNPIKVYGNTAGSPTIDGVAGSTGVTLTNGKVCFFFAVDNNVWISAQLGLPSA